MPRLEYSERFADDLAGVTSPKVETQILEALDDLELFGELGTAQVPASVTSRFGGGVRKIAVPPFDLVYTLYPDKDLIRVEALVPQRGAW